MQGPGARGLPDLLPVAASPRGCVGPDPAGGLGDGLRRRRATGRAPTPICFFDMYFEAVEIGDGAAFATGYYEPEIRGLPRRAGRAARCRSTQAAPICSTPIRATGARGRGRVDENGALRPLSRPRARSRTGRWPGAGWRSPGRPTRSTCSSCRSRARGGCGCPTAAVMRIGYAGQNGRDYVAIGRLLRERGILQSAGDHAGHRRLAARQSRAGPGADAREQELRLLPGADRAGAARARSACR